jgi:hypothetical protein
MTHNPIPLTVRKPYTKALSPTASRLKNHQTKGGKMTSKSRNVEHDYIRTVLLDGVEVEAVSKETGEVVPELSNVDAFIRGLEGNYKDITLAAEFFKENGFINTPFILFRIRERRAS